MKKLKVKVTFQEELLGMSNNDPEIYETYIASKAPTPKAKQEELEALDEETDMKEEKIKKIKTVFPRGEDDVPFFWDYQIKGSFKDTCGMLRRVKGTKSAGLKAFKKEIDGLIFVDERRIPIHYEGEIGKCQRPLRGATPQGETIAIAYSETVPAGSWIEFTVTCLKDDLIELVREWLDYGVYRGMGQWRNSGKGRFTWEEIK